MRAKRLFSARQMVGGGSFPFLSPYDTSRAFFPQADKPMENGTKKLTLEEVPSFLLSLSEKFDQVLALLASRDNLPPIEPFGDFKWLATTCQGVPTSTLRIKSAAGEIPGVAKVGKRVLYDKVAVLNWLRSQTRQPGNTALNEQQAEEQFRRQLSKKGGVTA